ncbi:hypothetical protein N0V93_004947 [Gnomoniopsis smithogilvyi]|uniref:Uncharacterized protein n=1 Tax=Gnomoniopsis smithogilvyi TaxID=1191159 RepID=A0A9W8YUM7_9PEZI|nr:hypothetical protein N0V93_004947 [Gnomoniopsis smithogilvyi]
MSSSPASSPPYGAVATLEFENDSTIPSTKGDYYILPGQTLKFGRDTQSNDYSFDSIEFSRNHLEFYSIIIDEEAESMVYVRDRQSANGTFVNGILIGRGNGITPGRLLEHRDVVTSKANWHFRVRLLEMKRAPLNGIQLAEAKFFSDQYSISDVVLGSGASTTVRLGHDVKTGQQLACKVYNLRERWEKDLRGQIAAIIHTVNLTKRLDHPNISSLKCAYKSRHTLFVFEELAAGGDLFSLVCGSIRLAELEIRWILRQVLSGLKYLHAKSIAHRDIKLENVLLCDCPNPAHRMALTDFGHAEVVPKGGSISRTAGTPGWQAPELFQRSGSLGVAVDMWSMGIMTVQLLIGSSESKMMAKIEQTLLAKAHIKALDFKDIFNEIYEVRHECGLDGSPRENFIRRCLDCDPNTRMTVDEALKHPYINEPASLRQQFETSEQETNAGWKSRVAEVEIRNLPDVVAPPSTSTIGKKEKANPNSSVAVKKSLLKKDIETLRSPYFKVTKSLGVKRARVDETTNEVESRAKRTKLVMKKTT